ncbi:hypothetical protein HUJ04_006421 [Dendroctonus ponderosae]|nr:hypothetical protein HUJ04_006421 [Dendroctonus ponderosae]KAH1005430.1 hypothetical protein HUJ04_006421 [Dendroctonus ponderosae]
MRRAIGGVALMAFFGLVNCQQLKGNQDDPCQIKARVISDITYCDRYWECVNGQPELYDCPNGLVFAGKNRGVTEGCDYPWRSNYCDGKQQATLCNDDPNGNVPLGKSCNRYWQCQGGYPRLQRCPAMLVFDRRSLRCVVPPTEDCDVPSTLPPPVQEDDLQENIPQNNPRNQHNFSNLPPGAIPIPSKGKPKN